jgi:hypothetical protein
MTQDAPTVALAVITRRLNDPNPILRFLDNAERFGHTVDRVVVAHSHGVKQTAADAVRHRVDLDVLHATGDRGLRDRLCAAGLDDAALDELLSVPSWAPYREAPYGAYRNVILLHALLEDLDALLFFDTDVYPKVLTGLDHDSPSFTDVDFVGGHVGTLLDDGVLATTSDYSGYYIIPPMAFDGLEPLLVGLRKEPALDYLKASRRHHCLNLGPPAPALACRTNKPLGGNLGLDLRHPEDLTLFFSTTYAFRGECIKGRGEDTLLGRAIPRSGSKIMDIDLRVFHDTFPDFPCLPDMDRDVIRTRFYYACLGWIGRNPFLTWFLDRIGELDMPFDDAIDAQRKGLRVGGPKAAQAFDDPRFADLGLAFEASLHQLPAGIRRYKRLTAGWSKAIKTIFPDHPLDRMGAEIGDDSPSAHGDSRAGKAGQGGDSFARSSTVV